MAIIDVIKWDANPEEVAHRCDIDNIALGSQLVVYPGQTAFFVKGGRVLDQFDAGTHTINSENIPLLRTIVAKPFGGTTPFQAQVWFVNGLSLLDCKWGTPSPIQMEDPKYGVIVPMRAYGQYGIRISSPRVFLERLVGSMPSFATQKVSDYFRGVILSKLNNLLSEKMYADSLSLININTHLEALSAYAEDRLADVFAAYGIALELFRIISINVDEADPSFCRLKETKDALARINIMGEDNYRLDRTFNVLDTAAGNDGGVAGAGVGFGAALGIGREMGTLAAGIMATDADVPPPLPASSVRYYLAIDGCREGPMTRDEVGAAVAAGRADARTLVWKRGLPDWVRMSDVPELASLVDDVPPIPDIQA